MGESEMNKPRALVHESLTEAQAFYLGQLVEESNEVAHRAMKCILWGLEDSHPKVGVDNRTALSKEIGNVEHTLVKLSEHYCTDEMYVYEGVKEKKDNLKKYHNR